MGQPLEGIKVIEIGQEIQGPFAAMVLADMGADVIKVENRETGDLSRWLTCGLIGGPEAKNQSVSFYFTALNRGKRSITVDLKKPGGVAIVRRLAQSCDVLMTNYRPGVLDRLGLGFDDLLKENPKIVYAQASSWGPKGPWVGRPSRDTLAQAASGLMAKTGLPEDPPLPAGITVADHSGALSLAAGVLGALFARERTGKGQRVDASIFGTLIAMQGFELNFVSFSGKDTLRAGRGHQFLHGVWGAYRTEDGWVCLAGVDDKRWPNFCRVMGIQHLENAPEFDNPTRNFQGWKIMEVLDGIFPSKTTKEWLDILTEIDILVAEVADYRMLLENDQARANGYLQELDHPSAGRVLVSGTPITYNGEVRTESPLPPEMGQHTEEILLEFGYTWEEIAALHEAEAI
jgi:crotonobetainyl-CoA:carnitine CoA-transferase CaiB-like acyl-CoA transferase